MLVGVFAKVEIEARQVMARRSPVETACEEGGSRVSLTVGRGTVIMRGRENTFKIVLLL